MFTSDQTRHFYVVTNALNNGTIAEDAPAGTLNIKSGGAEHAPYEPLLYMEYKTPNGNGGDLTLRTDLVPLANIEYVSAKPAFQRPYKRLVITFDNAVNGGAPVEGLKYSLAITFTSSQIGRDRGFTKYLSGYVAKSTDTAATVMADMLAKLNVLITTQKLPLAASLTGSTLTVQETARPFRLGKTNTLPITFSISSPAIDGAWNTAWATVADTTATNTNYQINGPEIANMEWFYLGERMPHGRLGANDDRFFRASYLADASLEYGTVDISYFYKGNNEDNQHSRKVISLAVAPASTMTAVQIGAAIDALRNPVEESVEP